MSRLSTTNQTGAVSLLYNPYQDACLKAADEKTDTGQWAYKILSLFAGRRAGKTKIGALITVAKMRNPNWLIWVCSGTYRALKDVVIPTILPMVPSAWIAEWRESDLELRLVNGTVVQFRSLEDPNTARGPGLNFAWLDEAREIQRLAWQTMIPALSDKNGQAIFTTTPNAYDWCYDDLWRPAEEQTQKGVWACKYKTADAPHYQTPQGKAEIAFARATMDPLFFQQEWEADFVSFAGAIYGRVWSEDLILKTDEQVRLVLPEWPKIDPRRTILGGIDPGTDHPFAAVLSAVTERGIVVFGEYQERNLANADHARGLYDMGIVDDQASPLQPQLWAIDKSQRQFALELGLLGLPIVPAENNVQGGINRVMSWLRAKQIFFIESRVPKTIKSLQGYQWADNVAKDGQTTPEKVKKINDDLPDALRYQLMLYPELPEVDIVTLSTRALQVAKMSEVDRWAMDRNRRCENTLRRPDDDEAGLLVYGEDLEPYGESEYGSQDAWNPLAEFWAA